MIVEGMRIVRFISELVYVVIGVARILSAGVHFFTTQQKLLKIDSCSGWGVHLVSCGGAHTFFL